MKIKKSSPEINIVIQATVKKLEELLNNLDFGEQSKNNPLYRKYAEDKLHHYIGMEVNRYVRALEVILDREEPERMRKVIDFGCMLPFMPVALAQLGFSVTMVDKYDYYGSLFKNTMVDFCAENKIKLIDLDIINDDFDQLGNCGIALNLSVVEHFNGSPLGFLTKVKNVLDPDGFIVFDVPNIANFVKRVRVMLGHSPLDDYSDYMNSPYPYSGHNREMTVSEVMTLLTSVGFNIDHLETYDFNPYSTVTKKGRFVRSIRPLIPAKNLGECILAVARV